MGGVARVVSEEDAIVVVLLATTRAVVPRSVRTRVRTEDDDVNDVNDDDVNDDARWSIICGE
jgi:hypothetical protein